MSKAASPSSKLTRRKAIAATLAGVAAPALAGPARLTPDPVFAAIAAHKAAYARLDQACLHVSRLEENIPEDRRQEWFDEDRNGFSWRNTLRYCATDQRLRPVGAFIPRSMRRRRASEREGLSG